MTPHEIKPKQLRALLLLLVLVPFIPTVLMIRFVLQTVESEREAALQRTRSAYQQTLLQSASTLAGHLATRAEPITPGELHDFFRDFLDPEAAVRIVDERDGTLAGAAPADQPILAQVSLREHKLPWRVELRLNDPTRLQGAVREQIKDYARTTVFALVIVFGIAIAAALTVSRQLALHDLKTTSLATVAHELRTPLASMRLLIDTLREGRYRGESQLQEYFDLIASENLRLSRLVDNFLTLSRLERNEHAISLIPTPTRAVVDRAVHSMRAKLDTPDCDFTLDLIEPLPEIVADRDSLSMVLMNLLDNAVKYTGEEKRVGLHAWAASGRVFFSITDNGVGLSRNERKNIFKRFYQVDQKLSRSRGGCGLGLALVHHIVETHHGRIDVESRLGRGSTFTVSVPIAEQTG